jgi:hypothetical protein
MWSESNAIWPRDLNPVLGNKMQRSNIYLPYPHENNSEKHT